MYLLILLLACGGEEPVALALAFSPVVAMTDTGPKTAGVPDLVVSPFPILDPPPSLPPLPEEPCQLWQEHYDGVCIDKLIVKGFEMDPKATAQENAEHKLEELRIVEGYRVEQIQDQAQDTDDKLGEIIREIEHRQEQNHSDGPAGSILSDEEKQKLREAMESLEQEQSQLQLQEPVQADPFGDLMMLGSAMRRRSPQ